MSTFGQKQRKRGGNQRKRTVWLIVLLIVLVCGAIGCVILIRNNTVSPHSQEFFSAGFSQSIVDSDPDSIPDYTGENVIMLDGNISNFTSYDCENIEGELYSDLDYLGRCGTATVMLDRSMMPTEERGEIGMIRPSGWNQEKYPGIVDSEPPYLYNRCHLIAYAMTGQNANEKNLITGTRFMNVELMLPYEKQVLRYLDLSDNHVLYRVSPLFRGNELLARGVEIEARSIEDEGRGVCFHVFIYNVQPGVGINYSDGSNWEDSGYEQ